MARTWIEESVSMALALVVLILPSCRKGGGSQQVRFFPINTAGNSGALFAGPDLSQPTQTILFGPGGASGRVDGPLSDPATAITLSSRSGAAADGAANLVYLACDDPSVRVIDLDAGTIATLSDEAAFAALDVRTSALGGVAIADAETLLVCDLSLNRIVAVDRTSGALRPFAGVASPSGGYAEGRLLEEARFDFSAGAGLAVDGRGRVLIADSGNHRIRMVQGKKVSTLAGSGTRGYLDGQLESARFDTPLGLSISARGQLIVSELGQRLRSIGPSGFFGFLGVGTVAGTGIKATVDGSAAPNGSASLDDPVTPIALAGGDLVWMDRGSGTLRWLIALTNAVTSPLQAFSVDSIFAMVVARDDSLLFFDSAAQAIVRID